MAISSPKGIPGSALQPRLVLGILGGLGPYAHILLEQYLLQAASRYAGVAREQDFPSWILSSLPQTPDRTAALGPEGPAALPLLLESLRRVEKASGEPGKNARGADLVLIACNTAHAFLGELRAATSLPILDMIDGCSAEVSERVPAGTRVGLLATTGTLRSGLYQSALRRHGFEPFSPLDTRDGERRQQEWIMDSIYGRPGGWEGLKTRGALGASTRDDGPREQLRQACRTLRDELRCEVLIAACTEIPLALPEGRCQGLSLINPLKILARNAIRAAYGLEAQTPPLPDEGS
ncbi:MAG: amino acid racemase [Acidobacteriota bacterium]|nr:amino acid racemase [Acidobacteriota bacterium]